VLGSPGLGYALALGMVVIAGVANALSIWLRTRSERWLR
jgi:putative spermidine/putrescine transport system permease protein